MNRNFLQTGTGRFLCVILLFMWSSLSWAADKSLLEGEDSAASPSTTHTAPVIFNGEVLTEIIGIRAYPATRRAREITEQLEAIAEDSSIDPQSLKIDQSDSMDMIVHGDEEIMVILDVDAEHVGLNDRHLLSDTYLTRIRESIREYRLDRTPERIKANIITAVQRSLTLIFLLVALRWIFRLLDRLVEKIFKRRIKKLEAKSMRVIQFEQVWRFVRAVMTLLKTLLTLGLIYIFLNYVLKLFPQTRYPAQLLLDLVLDPLRSMLNGFINYLPSLFFLIVLFLVTRYLLRILYGFFDAVNHQNLQFRNFEPEWAWPTYRIVRIIIFIFALVIAYPYIPGSSSDAFKGISLFLGVLLSLGSTSVIANIIAGYTMTYRRAFKIGDRVRIGETIGDVLDSRLLVTHIRSLKNEMVVIPNSTILNSEIINYSTLAKKKEGIILHTRVGIGYEVPWRQVEAMLIKAATHTSGLLQQPAPFVLQTALTDFAVTYELNAYCKDATKMAGLYSDLHCSIQDVFNEYGVQIMTPNYVADTPDPKLVPKEHWYAPPASKPEPRKE
jgi:small-conductance mechanosensitive channel